MATTDPTIIPVIHLIISYLVWARSALRSDLVAISARAALRLVTYHEGGMRSALVASPSEPFWDQMVEVGLEGGFVARLSRAALPMASSIFEAGQRVFSDNLRPDGGRVK